MLPCRACRPAIALASGLLMLAIPAASQRIPQQVPARSSTQLSEGFGMNLPLPRDPRLPWTRHWWTGVFDSGVKWVRIGQYENSSDKTSWDWVERTPGVYSVRPEVDEAIRSLRENGVSIELQLCYGNALYEGDAATRPQHINPAPAGIGDQDEPAPAIFRGLKTEDQIQGFLNYTRFMVRRYHDKIQYWEFWNEPNIGYWRPNVESRAARAAKGREYGRALCPVADVVHELDPQAKVIFGGTSEIDAPFVLAALGECPSKIDVMAYHTYPGYGRNEPPEEEDGLEEADLFREAVLRVPGVGKHLEFWENEWNSMPAWKNSNESVQARYLPRFFLQALSQGVKPFFWEFVPGTDGNEDDQTGLLHGETFAPNAFRPREAYRAFAVTSALFAQAELDPMADILLDPPARYNHGQLRKYAYRDRKSGKRIYAVWLAVVSDPADNFRPLPVEVGLPQSGITNPILVDVRTGRITPAVWIQREKQTLRIPLKDSVVAVTDASFLDWPEAPAAPGELMAVLSGHDVQLDWKKYGNAVGFELERSSDWDAWEKVTALPAGQTRYREPLARATHITYRVRAVGSKAPSSWSNPAWVDVGQP
ncbi:MAG TPA: hypothetical protein VEK33_13310 [Terriglobales bacterium]|nr:hypothetical protein [Terriglobales bacterium]